ncbi:methyltransferase, FkbM family [Salinihabitans flavidus]|uniref:Methyltransferase, FkbM family n=1 Tax=Salinihabitans flavidus TaxID=569882 RepID=A0A1H8SGZ4_9RHOB|nr:FkbM family methyltransferase [Salinihabitans flavidus]SEO77463.1 methyltransferase, FkbM family [Salinihabitans flavidus]
MTTRIVATYHGVEVPEAPHLGPTMIRNLEQGRYERREVLAALEVIGAHDRVVEMGAGAGIVGAVAAFNRKPEAMVAFEANHRLLPHIESLYRHNGIEGAIALHNEIVLSEPDAPQEAEFFIRGNFLGSGMQITKGLARAEKVRVPVRRWEALRAQTRPSVLLMDIEGAELDFFRHADLTGVRAVIVELHRNIYGRPGMKENRHLLRAQGFVIHEELSRGGVFVFERPEAG